MKDISRRIILLICVISIVVIYPLQVSASMTVGAGIAIGVVGVAAVASILGALGITTNPFNLPDFTTSCEFIYDSLPSFYKLLLDGQNLLYGIRYDDKVYFDKELVAYITSFIADSVIVSSPETIPEYSSSISFDDLAKVFSYYYNKNISQLAGKLSTTPYVYLHEDAYKGLSFSFTSVPVSKDNYNSSESDSHSQYHNVGKVMKLYNYPVGSTSWNASLNNFYFTYATGTEYTYLGRLYISDTLNGLIITGDYADDIESDEYKTWVDTSEIIEVTYAPDGLPDDSGSDQDEPRPVPFIPIEIVKQLEDILTTSQPEFQNPSSDLSDNSNIIDISNSGTGSGGSTDSGGSGSSVDPDSLVFDLREFFPFCIPFDIYNLVTMFVAEPVAPVFEWEIPVPSMGKSFKLEVDLSAWDGIAQLFRTLELVGFIIGLGWITRDKILRG